MLRTHLGHLGIGRVGMGPLLAPIWYAYDAATGIHFNMGATSAKVKRLRAEGRASKLVVEATNGAYRSVLGEGPVTMRALADETEAAMLAMSSRYLGDEGGQRYTRVMRLLATNDFPDGHGGSEVVVTHTRDMAHRNPSLNRSNRCALPGFCRVARPGNRRR